MSDDRATTAELELLGDLIAVVPGHCSYADARWVSHTEEVVVVEGGALSRAGSERAEGVGVRVRLDGRWGFAATHETSPEGVRAALTAAIAFAEAQPAPPSPAPLVEVPAAAGHWAGPAQIDPFSISLGDKVTLLLEAEAALRGDPRMIHTEARCRSALTRKAFASTEGAACSQATTQCGGGLQAIAVGDGEAQVRSYPAAHGGGVAAAGWEHVRGLDLAAHAPRVAEEAVALLTAPVCPRGPATIVLHGEQLALQIHESIGHALELDRILFGEAAYAGTSWVSAADLGTLRYGSEHLNVTADATLPGGLGSFGWDDEGVPAGRTELIRGGVLQAALSDRESAAALGLAASGGCSRADGFARQPIVRMTNVSLEPGSAGTLRELLADTDQGLYLEGNRSWSIDDRRLNFQFATEVAREIRDGELGRLYRNAGYTGTTPRFWASLDAVCSRPEWSAWGLLNCGKGEPGQLMHVSHGTAPARFRSIDVGIV